MRDLTGETFGRWTVLSRADDNIGRTGYRTVVWNCVCECGKHKTVRGKSLIYGISRSCGCLQRELVGERASTHKGYGTRLYAIWDSMRQRCNNPHNNAYTNYGARGITICEEWNDFASFRAWAICAGYDENAVRGDCTLDRIDVNLGYSPENCRFIDMRTQSNNRRESIVVEHNGETHPLSVWAEILGVKYCTLWRRYKRKKSLI